MKYSSLEVAQEVGTKIQRILELFQRARGSAHVTSVWYGDFEFRAFAEAAVLDRVAFEIQKAGITPYLVATPEALYRAQYDFPGISQRRRGWTLRWDGGKNHGLWNTFNDNGERISEPPYLTTYEIIQKQLVSLDSAVQQLLETAETNVYTRREEASRLLRDTAIYETGHSDAHLRVPTRSDPA